MNIRVAHFLILLLTVCCVTSVRAQIGPPPATAGSGMLANGTYSVTGKFSSPHCPLVASSGTFTPTLAAASCPASSSDGVSFFDVPLASGANTLAFPTNGSAGQTFVVNFTGPTSGTPTLTSNAGYIFPSAALSSGNVPLTGANGLDQLECSLAQSSASYAQGGLAAWCNVVNTYVTTSLATPSLVASNPSNFSGSNNTGSGGATSLTPSGTLQLTAGDYLVIYDTGTGNSGYTAAKPNFTGATVSAGAINSCVLGTGTRISTQSSGYDAGTELQVCLITSSGAASITGSWASTCYNCSFLSMDVHNLNATTPDAGIGATASGTSATASVSTGSSSAGKQYFYVTSAAGNGAGTFGTPSGWTQIIGSGSLSWSVYYEIAPSSTSPVNVSSTITTSENWGISVWAGTP